MNNLKPYNDNSATIGNMDTFLDDCFEAFGDRIVAVHAKDYRMLPSASGAI
ncbi:hypothetical protein [Teredinibacter franksiae]|uniref:hypothetical protein n=1 Tax=Teredinibacter franksiae TaxID=2761453 RepID=UPI0016297742|nr:hypothetical protein [Teredinibacter franksiae]